MGEVCGQATISAGGQLEEALVQLLFVRPAPAVHTMQRSTCKLQPIACVHKNANSFCVLCVRARSHKELRALNASLCTAKTT